VVNKNSPGYPYGEFDAKKWVEEFERLYPNLGLDEGVLLGWFANSIMTGYDYHANNFPCHTHEDCPFCDS
jgi:hypothetical protein